MRFEGFHYFLDIFVLYGEVNGRYGNEFLFLLALDICIGVCNF